MARSSSHCLLAEWTVHFFTAQSKRSIEVARGWCPCSDKDLECSCGEKLLITVERSRTSASSLVVVAAGAVRVADRFVYQLLVPLRSLVYCLLGRIL